MNNFQIILSILFYLYLLGTIILLLLDNRDSTTTLAWLLVFMLFPIAGLIEYFLIGRNWRPKRKERRLKQQQLDKNLNAMLEPIVQEQNRNLLELERMYPNEAKRKIIHLLYSNSDSILTSHNQVKVFYSGKEKFDALCSDIEKARSFIHLEYYIWRNDKLTRKITRILEDKVKAGVEVRILFDAVGSLALTSRYTRSLQKAGIQIYPYYDFRSPLTIHTLNYRNHRKIIVIDGQVGYAGGMNMAQEYIDGGKRFDTWRDAHLRIEGEAVAVLQSVFATSWLNTGKESIFQSQYFPTPKKVEQGVPMQITTSGPDSAWESIQQLYFTLIASAARKVYIQSPYFVPDKSIYMALQTAALSGVDVRLMMTGLPDRRLPFWSAFTFYEKLLLAGVKIYQYKAGFLHAKTICVDEDICSVGTANMDIRSFHLNYESNTLIYDKSITDEIMQSFQRDLELCEEITLEYYDRLSVFEKFRNSFSRLFSPLL